MPTAQINARIDSEVKRNGDRAFAEIGYSPTHVIRAMWDFAGRNRGNKEALRSVMSRIEGTDSTEDDELAKRICLAEEGPKIFTKALANLGIKNASDTEEVPYEELLAQAYDEKYQV